MDLQTLENLRKKHQSEGNTIEEVKVLREILLFCKQNFTENSDEYIKSLNELGGTLKYIGLYEEAEQRLKEGLNIISQKYGENTLAYATNLLNLTEVYRFSGKFDNLEKNYLKILDIYEKNDFLFSESYAAFCNNFGLYYQNINNFQAAYDLHMKSLNVVQKLGKDEYILEYAVTLSNLFNPCLNLNEEDTALKYLNESIDIFEKNVGVEHPLYAASLNNLAIYYFNKNDYSQALGTFEKAALISKKTMGVESDNYKNILSNIDFLRARLEANKSDKSEIKTEKHKKSNAISSSKIRGLELAKKYFEEVVLEKFKEELPSIFPLCAFGLIGEGSECFGFDDDISQDHDFGAEICIWLKREDYNKYSKEIETFLETLPKNFMGLPPVKKSEWGAGRRGVICIEDFYFKFLGQETLPKTIADWQKIPETALACVTNGEVFLDNLGLFSKIRLELKKYYPEAIRQNKIATRCMNISQHGQYNYVRCLKRNELVAANQALYLFVDEVIHLVFLLNGKYKIFYKWSHRALLDLDILGDTIHKILAEMVFVQNKIPFVKKICYELIQEIKKQNLSKIESDYLGDYGVDIQQNIDDPFFRKYSPWLD